MIPPSSGRHGTLGSDDYLAVMLVMIVIGLGVLGWAAWNMWHGEISRAAMTLVDYMRTARTMAIGRGQPILVSWSANSVQPVTHPGGQG